MNYFLQSFPFLLIERRTVVSHWQNPTPGPFVSIRWEQLGVISLPSPPINWEIIQMRTQLSNNIVSSHDHENSRTNGPTFVTASSVHVFKVVYQRTNFSQIGKVPCGFGADWHMYRIIMGKTSKYFSLKRRDPQLIDVCLMVTYINPAIRMLLLSMPTMHLGSKFTKY